MKRPAWNSLQLFRIATVFAAVTIGIQEFPMLMASGPAVVRHMHEPLIGLLGWLGLNAPAHTHAQFWITVAIEMTSVPLFAIAAWWLLTADMAKPREATYWVLAFQSLLGIVICDDWLLLVAAEAAILLGARPAMRYLAMQLAGYALLRLVNIGLTTPDAALLCGMASESVKAMAPPERLVDQLLEIGQCVVFQVLAFGAGYMAYQERQRQRMLTAVNAQTEATHRFLAEAIRAGERKRIARELHDALGHQLAAINLHLELAQRRSPLATSSPAGAPTLADAKALAQELLSQLRTLVGRERVAPTCALVAALHSLCGGPEQARIAMHCDDAVSHLPPRLGQAVLRAAQCIVNTAMAAERTPDFSIHVAPAPSGAIIRVSDVHDVRLKTLRDHLAELSGALWLSGISTVFDSTHSGVIMFTLSLVSAP
jgi:signal transduction histidine kinase